MLDVTTSSSSPVDETLVSVKDITARLDAVEANAGASGRPGRNAEEAAVTHGPAGLEDRLHRLYDAGGKG